MRRKQAERYYSGSFATRSYTFDSTGNLEQKILDSNPDRAALIFSTVDTGGVTPPSPASKTWTLSPELPPSSLEGLIIKFDDTPLQLTRAEWGEILGAEWYGLAGFGGLQLAVLELIYKKPRPVRLMERLL